MIYVHSVLSVIAVAVAAWVLYFPLAVAAEEYTIYSKDIDILQLGVLFSQNSSVAIMDSMPQRSPCFEDEVSLFNHEYVVREALAVMKAGISLVSLPRLIATVWLARAAGGSRLHGDFVETGVFKGGTAILMIRTMHNFDRCHREFWGFDSFQGLPDQVAEDRVGKLSRGSAGEYFATEKMFMKNLRRFKSYERPEHIHVAKGFFNETLPISKVSRIVYLRLDGDMFSSTWDTLVHMYPKVVPGGYVYVDDYDSFNGCKRAVDMYREQNKITEPMVKILEGKRPDQKMKRHYEAVWWQKSLT